MTPILCGLPARMVGSLPTARLQQQTASMHLSRSPAQRTDRLAPVSVFRLAEAKSQRSIRAQTKTQLTHSPPKRTHKSPTQSQTQIANAKSNPKLKLQLKLKTQTETQTQ